MQLHIHLTMTTPPPAEEEEEVVCRVCQLSLEDEPEKRLFYPCRCSGSIKYVHEDCLAQWLRVKKSQKDVCEVCGEKKGGTYPVQTVPNFQSNPIVSPCYVVE